MFGSVGRLGLKLSNSGFAVLSNSIESILWFMITLDGFSIRLSLITEEVSKFFAIDGRTGRVSFG